MSETKQNPASPDGETLHDKLQRLATWLEVAETNFGGLPEGASLREVWMTMRQAALASAPRPDADAKVEEICPYDQNSCHVGDDEEGHFRCGTVQCGRSKSPFKETDELCQRQYNELAALEKTASEALQECERLRAEAEKAGAVWTLIDELRAPEGASVTLGCDNPDFHGPNSFIEVCDDWTSWKDERFEGETVLAALSAAKTERDRRALGAAK